MRTRGRAPARTRPSGRGSAARILLLVAALGGGAVPARGGAKDLTFAGYGQFLDPKGQYDSQKASEAFQHLAREVGATIQPSPMAPPDPLPPWSVMPQVGYAFTFVDSRDDAWTRATRDGNPYDPQSFVRGGVSLGLPGSLDIKAAAGTIPYSNVTAWDGEGRWALLPGSVVSPAVGIRGAYSTLFGPAPFEMETSVLDLAMTQRFVMLSPYGGIGTLFLRARHPSYGRVSETELHWFFGLQWSARFFKVAFGFDGLNGVESSQTYSFSIASDF